MLLMSTTVDVNLTAFDSSFNGKSEVINKYLEVVNKRHCLAVAYSLAQN